MAKKPPGKREARSRDISSVPEEILALPYFHPNIKDSQTAAKQVLKYATGCGYFLLRQSSKGDNYLSLSVSINAKSVRHVNVVIEKKSKLRYYIIEEVKFNSFKELHNYYCKHRICNQEQISDVKLMYPVIRSVDVPVSSPIDMPGDRRKPSISIPETPSSQKLNPAFEFESENLNSSGDQYVSGSSGSPAFHERLLQKHSSTSRDRPLPPRPDERPDQESLMRPPFPLPSIPHSSEYYSKPLNEDENRIDQLRQVLRSQSDGDMCDCGVPLRDSLLPLGWTVHQSNETETMGYLFYQNDAGETTWSIPMDIVPLLTEQQRRFIVSLSVHNRRFPPKALSVPVNTNENHRNS